MSTRKFTLLSLPKLTLFYLPLIVVGFVVVHIDAVAVHRFAEAMSRAVQHVVAVAGAAQH